MEFLQLLIAGGVITAAIKLFEPVVGWVLSRISGKWDRKIKSQKDRDAEIEALRDQIRCLTRAQRVSLQDRIRYLGKGYIRCGQIDADDRADLLELHNAYHNDLGGNGKLDYLIEQVKKLPVIY